MRTFVLVSSVLLYTHPFHFATGLHKEFNKQHVEDFYQELVRDDGSKKMANVFHEKLLKSVDCEAACREGNFVNEGMIWNSKDEEGRKRCLESCQGEEPFFFKFYLPICYMLYFANQIFYFSFINIYLVIHVSSFNFQLSQTF